LEVPKKLSIEIDLSKDVVFPFIKMIQHDTNILEFVVKENGADADLSNIGRIVAYYRRRDKKEIPRLLKPIGNKINYEIGYQEMKLFGEGQIEIQFYSLDNLSRVSTKRFKIYLSGSSGTDLVVESDKDLTLLQELFVEVSDLKTLAAQSTDIVDSEAERIENEDFRTANEDTRIANESSRVGAEGLRNTAEATRNTQEDSREQAEVIREENEDIRLENEMIRQSAESTRSNSEETRQTKESERLMNESDRVSAESIRRSNESNRQSNEATRSNNEAQRIDEENVRKSAETSRINSETVRVDNENVRQQQEAARQVTIQQAVIATENTNAVAVEAAINSAYAKEQAEKAKEAAETAKTYWLNPVANFAAISTTYPSALDGSQVITTNDQMEYRKINGSWQWTGVRSANGLAELQAKFNDANMQIQTLSNGTSILTSALTSPVLIEVQGRTLTSLGNSNLEGGKLYVLSDKRTKIRAEGREGTLLNGVAKFTKSASLITKADFVGKVAGSVTENAHVGKRSTGGVTTNWNTLQTPSYSNFVELAANEYTAINSLNSSVNVNANSNNGGYAQQLFSFSIIELIERRLGRIPSDTVSGKVQWIKDNVNRLTANWHGWGSSVGGFGASLKMWLSGSNAWSGASATHANSNVTKIDYTASSAASIDNNGFMHYLAFTTNPSDGTTPSQLNTDFIELECELKSTAVLDTRPIVTRTATFEGKLSGDLVSNPHVAKRTNGGTGGSTTLLIPSAFPTEMSNAELDLIKTLNSTIFFTQNSGNGQMAQHLFSWNLIEEIERNIGRIPKSTVAEKVQWLKDNVDKIIVDWHGFGSSVGGNKATTGVWTGSAWFTAGGGTHSLGTVAKISRTLSTSDIQTDSFVHILAFAEPSDGATASTINTDFISLDITLKQGATLFDPVLPLYEVDTTEYANILVSWDETNVLNRYPKVQGVQHLQNVAVISEGENLLPSIFDSSVWGLNAAAIAQMPYEFKIPANISGNTPSSVTFPVTKNTDFTLSLNLIGGRTYVHGNITGSILGTGSQTQRTFNTGVNTSITVYFDKASTTLTEVIFSNITINVGSTPKPHVPRNPSYLFAPVKLGQIGDKKDSLFQDLSNNGQWVMRKTVEKDVVLDGSLDWKYSTDFVGYKTAYTTAYIHPNGNSNTLGNVMKFNGQMLTKDTVSGASALINYDKFILANTSTVVSIADVDSGWGESYSPTVDDIKRYFNGWKYTDGTTWQSVTGNGQSTTGSNALITKPTDYTPYKLSYALASPQTINVNHLVEGAISVSGQTMVTVDSGVVVREKVTPVLIGNTYYINSTSGGGASKLKNRLSKFVAIYKNGQVETWAIDGQNAHGNLKATLPQALFDPTAEYTVTYLVLDRHLFTVNATEVKTSYAGSLKDTVDMTTEQLTDLKTQTSINTNLIYRLLVQAKANNWSV
jgi:hypothetical protein